ncbi:transposase [Ensifer adhaerens]|nr:transposase [Ensifer adhaerens]UAY02615.1 transposase [Ensifer adhaerens]UAY10599.1 transposase [Ensifer adhaerens]
MMSTKLIPSAPSLSAGLRIWRHCGWALRGRPLAAPVPRPLENHDLHRCLRCIDAPCVVDGQINGEFFILYVQKVLAPPLAKGDIVIFDNLGSNEA